LSLKIVFSQQISEIPDSYHDNEDQRRGGIDADCQITKQLSHVDKEKEERVHNALIQLSQIFCEPIDYSTCGHSVVEVTQTSIEKAFDHLFVDIFALPGPRNDDCVACQEKEKN
jgi:hypothetical protein